MNKRFLLSLVAIAAILLGIFAVTHNKGSSANGGSTASNASGQASQHYRGNTSSKVVFVEYGDFQCPACGAYYPLVEQVYAKYQDRVKFQFRNFPLVQIHQNAQAGARAAEAANLQGKYWDMYNQLYKNQETWASSTNVRPIFESYAQSLGLDVNKFKTDYASDAVNRTINADLGEGHKLKVQGTPTFFLNGKEITDKPRDVDGFSKLLDAELAKAGQTAAPAANSMPSESPAPPPPAGGPAPAPAQ
jgi:protein-disulfide isomerase